MTERTCPRAVEYWSRSLAAIARLSRPPAMNSSTSRSLGVSRAIASPIGSPLGVLTSWGGRVAGGMSADDAVDHSGPRCGLVSPERGYGRQDRARALGRCPMLDLEVGRPSLEDGHDRVRDRSCDRVVLGSEGLEEVGSDRDPCKTAVGVVGCPRFIGPGDVPIGVEDRDCATLQFRSGVAPLPTGHDGSVRLLQPTVRLLQMQGKTRRLRRWCYCGHWCSDQSNGQRAGAAASRPR
jgi:hypothetical protein